MKNIIYFEPQDSTAFDLDRYQKSLGRYVKVPATATKEALKELEKYENVHVSLLVETGTALINQFGDEQAAKKYFTDHQ